MNLTFQAAWVVIMSEVLAVLVIAVSGFLVYHRHKKQQALQEIDRFVDKINDHAPLKTEPLEQMLTATDQVAWEVVEQTVKGVNEAERALFQQIIEFYLLQNPTLLNKIEKQVGQLSEPYHQLIKHLMQNPTVTEEFKRPNLQADENDIPHYQLTQQLRYALQTIEEITAEYTRVFNGRQTTLELENSSQRMLQLFKETEHRLNQIHLIQTEDF